MTIGSGTDESPMWLQLNPSRGGNTLKFENSQRRGIAFEIEIPEDDKRIINGCYDEAYDYFKWLKYTHIKNSYPTVWNELAEGINGDRINNFLKSYKSN
jgi:hypothetical protein